MNEKKVYESMAALNGQPSVVKPAPAVVWVPGMGNGAQEALVKELLARGWVIQPPEEASKKAAG